ncbi:hypothetical protein SEUCBS139899_010009 [Sporothrix eucalyptigena]
MDDLPHFVAGPGSLMPISQDDEDDDSTIQDIGDDATISDIHEDRDEKVDPAETVTEPSTIPSTVPEEILKTATMATDGDDTKPVHKRHVTLQLPVPLPSGLEPVVSVENTPALEKEDSKKTQASASDSGKESSAEQGGEQAEEMFAGIPLNDIDLRTIDVNQMCQDNVFSMDIVDDEHADAVQQDNTQVPPQSVNPQADDVHPNSFEAFFRPSGNVQANQFQGGNSQARVFHVEDAPNNKDQGQVTDDIGFLVGNMQANDIQAKLVVNVGVPTDIKGPKDTDMTDKDEIDSWLDELSVPMKKTQDKTVAPQKLTADMGDAPVFIEGTLIKAAPVLPLIITEEAVMTTLASAVQPPEQSKGQPDEVLPDASEVPPQQAPPQENASSKDNPVQSVEVNGVDLKESVFVDAHPGEDHVDLLDFKSLENMPLLADAPMPGYVWHDASTMPEEQAIRVLEEAVDSALQFGHEVLKIFTGSSTEIDNRINVQQWTDEFKSICEAQDGFEVLVGVSGATGTGKTTIINALLDINELLPSGSDSAATATVCKVHKARDSRVAPAFKAVVSFKTEKDIRAWLDPILEDVDAYHVWYDAQQEKERKRLEREEEEDEEEEEEIEDGDAGDDDDEYFPAGGQTGKRQPQRIKDAAQNKKRKSRKEKQPVYEEDEEDDSFDCNTLREKLVCVESVFGLGVDDLRGWTSTKLLNSKIFPIMRRIGKTKTIVSDNKDNFAKTVRPFLDSTPIGDDFDYDDFDDVVSEDDDDDEKDEEDGDDADEEEGYEGEGDEKDEEGEDEYEDEDKEGDSHGFQASPPTHLWPLVAQVNIYLKEAPLLKNGIVLADVPGLADALEERARVARDCFEKLDITIIVAPAIRAVDDATCAQLLTDNEELFLRVTNRFRRRNFCVVSSKTDDLEWEQYLQREIQTPVGSTLERCCRAYAMLQEVRANENKKIRDIKAHVRSLKSERDLERHLQNQTGVSDLEERINEIQQETIPELQHNSDTLANAIEFYKGLLAFHTTSWRNRKIQKSMQARFQRRTQTVEMQTARQRAAAGNVVAKQGELIDVIPASAKAYWALDKRKDEDDIAHKLVVGYPEARFSGIPAMRAWIRRATIPMRQRHAISLLRRLMVLLVQLKTGYGYSFKWETSESPAPGELGATPPPKPGRPATYVTDNPAQEVHKVLSDFEELLLKNLGFCADALVDRVERCNPMTVQNSEGDMVNVWAQPENVDNDGNKKRSKFTPKCRTAVLQNVKSWQYRTMDKTVGTAGGSRRAGPDPAPVNMATCFIKDIKGNNAKVAWTTHAAIIRRNGGHYVSKGKIPGRYTWMRTMASLVMADVVNHWEEAMHDHLPRETEAARNILIDAWDRALTRLRALLPPYFPENEHAFLGEQLVALHAIRDRIVDGVQRAMEDMAKQSKSVLSSVENELIKGWKPIFAKATAQSGKGVFKTRQMMLESYARSQTTPLVKKALIVLDQQFGSNLSDFKGALVKIWEEGHGQIIEQLNAILRRIDRGSDTNGLIDKVPQLKERARRINALIHQWEGDWKAPDAYTYVSGEDGGADAIPTDYITEPQHLSIENLLPDFVDVPEEEEEDVLAAELAIEAQPKRSRKRQAANAGAGAKEKATLKKRKVAPKKTKERSSILFAAGLRHAIALADTIGDYTSNGAGYQSTGGVTGNSGSYVYISASGAFTTTYTSPPTETGDSGNGQYTTTPPGIVVSGDHTSTDFGTNTAATVTATATTGTAATTSSTAGVIALSGPGGVLGTAAAAAMGVAAMLQSVKDKRASRDLL